MIKPICCPQPLNDFPFIENTFKELDLYSLCCAVAQKVNELVEQGNTVEKSLTILFNNAIRDGVLTTTLNAENINGVLKIYVEGVANE